MEAIKYVLLGTGLSFFGTVLGSSVVFFYKSLNKKIERCCLGDEDTEKLAHFEIPQVITDFGTDAIEYIGATDRQLPFIWYNNIS